MTAYRNDCLQACEQLDQPSMTRHSVYEVGRLRALPAAFGDLVGRRERVSACLQLDGSPDVSMAAVGDHTPSTWLTGR